MASALPRTKPIAGTCREALRLHCHDCHRITTQVAAAPVQKSISRRGVARWPAPGRVARCYADAGSSSQPAGGPSPSPIGAVAGAAAGKQSSRSSATAADGGRAAALQEALRVVLSEQAKQLTPLLRQELQPLMEQVVELRAELQRVDARLQQEHQQQGANVPDVQESEQRPQQQGQQQQQVDDGGDALLSAGADGAQRLPELLDYVVPVPGSEFEATLRELALNGKVFGRVLFRDPLTDELPTLQVLMPQVRANPKTWLYVTDAVVVPRSRVAEEALLPEVLPYDPARLGAPVTPFTAASGMLVRRGHDWRGEEGTNGENGEIGVLQYPRKRRDVWTVVWTDGSTGKYYTGKLNTFELSHVAVCESSGAPVMWAVGSQQLQRAADARAAVVRGAHWVARDGGPTTEKGRLQKVGTSAGEAVVQVQWEGMPEGYAQLVPLAPRTTASSHRTFPLNYVARPGEPVTVMIARKGLRVTPNPRVQMQHQPQQQVHPGPDGRLEERDASSTKASRSGADAAAGAAAPPAAAVVVPVGTLLRPWEVEEGCVWWTVDWGDGEDDGVLYQVGATHSDPCELQVAV